MAEKHKSKYKAPKDLEKSQKPKVRKDLKDYTEEDKQGSLNPKSTGEKQLNVLRKTDKETVDTGDMYVKYNADDRLYKDLEDGEYDPKHASKVLKKRQDKDETDNKKNIKDKIENLTREQREDLVRSYVRKKIFKMLLEQPEKTDEPTDEPTDDAAPTEPVTPMASTPSPSPAAPTDTATPPPAPDAATPPPSPATSTPPPAASSTELTPEEQENRVVTAIATELSTEGGVGKIKLLNNILNIALKDNEPADKESFYKLLRSYAIKKIGKIQSTKLTK